jgi:hypothetical protein
VGPDTTVFRVEGSRLRVFSEYLGIDTAAGPLTGVSCCQLRLRDQDRRAPWVRCRFALVVRTSSRLALSIQRRRPQAPEESSQLPPQESSRENIRPVSGVYSWRQSAQQASAGTPQLGFAAGSRSSATPFAAKSS